MCSFTDLQGEERNIFPEGELIKSRCLASAAYLQFFSPVEFKGRLYADGGIMNNLSLWRGLPILQTI